MMILQRYPYGQKINEKASAFSKNKDDDKLINFVNALLNIKDSDLLEALIDLEKELSYLSDCESESERNKLSKLRVKLRSAMISQRGDTEELDIIRKEINSCLKKIGCMNLGLEHIFREVSAVYEISQQCPVAGIARLPEIAARLFLDGQPMELVDGDAGNIPLVWFTALCQNIIKQRPELRVFVVSVIGLQSTGKSTLLNSLFACRFAVSVGRTTRGLFMRLLLLDDELVKTHNFDAILLIDTEGLGSVEKMNDPEAEKKDRLLATFAMGISNLTLINVMGENMVDMTEILQIAIVTMSRLEKAGIAVDILLVQYLFTERNMDKTSKGLDQFSEAIRKALTLVNEKSDSVGMQNAKCLRVLCERIEKETLLVQFHPYKDGATVNAPPSELYHQDVVDLYNKILESGKSSKTIVEFKTWCELVASYWECVKHEDFALRFKNIKQMYEFIDRGNNIAVVKQDIDAAFAFHERCLLRERTGWSNDNISRGERQKVREQIEKALNDIPSTCRIQRDMSCDLCCRMMEDHKKLVDPLKGQPCEEETHTTIDSYLSKTRLATVNKLAIRFDALVVQHGCSTEYDKLINERLRQLLGNSQQGSYTEEQCAKITDQIFQELKLKASSYFERDVPMTEIFKKDLVEEYKVYKDFAVVFRKKSFQFKDVIQNSVTDWCTKQVYQLIKVIKPTKVLSATEQVEQLEKLIAEMPSKIIDDRHAECYEHGMIRDLRLKVTTALEEFKTANRKIHATMNEMYVHVWTQQLLLNTVIKLQDSWDKQNKPSCILEANKETYKAKIKSRLQFGFTFKSEGEILARRLIEAVIKIAKDAANSERKRRVLDLGWIQNSQRVKLQYLKELACDVRNGEKARALHHFRNPKDAIVAWFTEQVDNLNVPIIEIFQEKYSEELESITKDILDVVKIRDVYRIVNSKCKQTTLQRMLIKTMYAYGISDAPIGDNNDNNFEVFRNIILEALKSFEPATWDITFYLPSTDRAVMARLGCTERCYMCGALCWGERGHDENNDDTRKHHSSHQPMGLNGHCDVEFHRLLALPCDKVSPFMMVHFDGKNKGLRWDKATKTKFSNWRFDQHYRAECNKLMHWFFQELHTEIARKNSSETREVLPASEDDLEQHECVDLEADSIIALIDTQQV